MGMKNFKNLFLLFMLIVFTTTAFSQTVITGKVVSKKNPLPGISITLKDTYDGTTTDSSGVFKFSTSEKGDILLTVTGIGYKPFEQKLTLPSSRPVVLDINLKEDVTELNAVILSAGTFEAGDKKTAETINKLVVKEFLCVICVGLIFDHI